tara:strand:+ start:14519 stop:15427 length:909 start_codon:yes stop_codon:yes gene_type:complete
MNYYFILFVKGMAMGIANVIPGVSGGTIALITNIYEELINSLKSFDKKALKFILKGDIKGFSNYTNLYFLLSIFTGAIVIMLFVASLFEYLFENYRVLVWSFFFGLIIASIYFVGRRVTKWGKNTIISFLLGTTIALSLSLINKGGENNDLFFIFICGIVGISGMMLPGLSGSFILILMGNYELLMVKSLTIEGFNIKILSIFCLGSVFGLLSFSHILAWILKKYKNITLSLLTGFIFGSLSITWPWQNPAAGSTIEKDGKKVVTEWVSYVPDFNNETIFAIILISLGFFTVYCIEMIDTKK